MANPPSKAPVVIADQRAVDEVAQMRAAGSIVPQCADEHIDAIASTAVAAGKNVIRYVQSVRVDH